MTEDVAGKPASPQAPLGPVEAVSGALKNYAKFTGRARRSEYWWFFLFWIIAIFATSFISQNLAAIVVLALILPSLGVGIRRLHDIGKSGWWCLISLIPVIGALVLIYWAVQPSGGDNAYGPAPA